MVVGDDEGGLVVALHIAVIITIVPAFFGGQPFDKGQVAFPVLDAVFPFFGVRFKSNTVSIRPRSSSRVRTMASVAWVWKMRLLCIRSRRHRGGWTMTS